MSNFLQERFFGKGIFFVFLLTVQVVLFTSKCVMNVFVSGDKKERKIYKETTPSRVVGQEDGGGGHTHTAGFLSSSKSSFRSHHRDEFCNNKKDKKMLISLNIKITQ